MNRLKINFLIFIIILFPAFIQSEENGTKVQLLCGSTGSTFDVIGDSRSFLFWGNNDIKIKDSSNRIIREGNALNTAMLNGKSFFLRISIQTAPATLAYFCGNVEQ